MIRQVAEPAGWYQKIGAAGSPKRDVLPGVAPGARGQAGDEQQASIHDVLLFAGLISRRAGADELVLPGHLHRDLRDLRPRHHRRKRRVPRPDRPEAQELDEVPLRDRGGVGLHLDRRIPLRRLETEERIVQRNIELEVAHDRVHPGGVGELQFHPGQLAGPRIDPHRRHGVVLAHAESVERPSIDLLCGPASRRPGRAGPGVSPSSPMDRRTGPPADCPP